MTECALFLCVVVRNFNLFRPTGRRFVSLNQSKIFSVESWTIPVQLLDIMVTNLMCDLISELILHCSRILSSVWSLASTNSPTTVSLCWLRTYIFNESLPPSFECCSLILSLLWFIHLSLVTLITYCSPLNVTDTHLADRMVGLTVVHFWHDDDNVSAIRSSPLHRRVKPTTEMSCILNIHQAN